MHIFSSRSSMAEQETFNLLVPGSSPGGSTATICT